MFYFYFHQKKSLDEAEDHTEAIDQPLIDSIANKIEDSVKNVLARQEEDREKVQELIDVTQYKIKTKENDSSIEM